MMVVQTRQEISEANRRRHEDTSERINCADTVKVQWSAAISEGRVILSEMGRGGSWEGRD
jgi:hypothetical protein